MKIILGVMLGLSVVTGLTVGILQHRRIDAQSLQIAALERQIERQAEDNAATVRRDEHLVAALRREIADVRVVPAAPTTLAYVPSLADKKELHPPGRISSLTTSDGETYEDVRVTDIEPDGLDITHSRGAGKILFVLLPPEIQTRYGYDKAQGAAYHALIVQRQAAQDASAATR